MATRVSRVWNYWTLIGPVRRTGDRVINDGVWYGRGIPLGRTMTEAQDSLRERVDLGGIPLPGGGGLQLVQSPYGVEYVWDPYRQVLELV